MGKKTVLPFLILAIAAGVWGMSHWFGSTPQEQVQARLVGVPAPITGFVRVEGPQPLQFPLDFGPHPDYQTEWWYYTGNLETQSGRHFGYQLTFFRRAVTPVDQGKARLSDWSANQVYLAHFALTDVGAGRFQSFERLQRGAAGLAGAQGQPEFQVWLDQWSVQQVGTNHYHLQAAQDGFSLDLNLVDTNGPVLQGDRGYSQKGPEKGNASIYFSQPHLVSDGTIHAGNQDYAVTGLSWMDHEYSTSALSQGQVGWDWFALQLNDGSELTVFHIRRADGSIDPYSSGTWIGADGSVRRLTRDDFKLSSSASWRSPHSKALYPAQWSLEILPLKLKLQVNPYVADQENNLSFTYWEGAVSVQGNIDGKTVAGSGYVELTGYAKSMTGQF